MAMFEGSFDSVRLAFSRLTQREQFIVLGGGIASLLIVLLGVGLLVSKSIDKTEYRLKIKTEQLLQVFELQGAYKRGQEERAQQLKDLSRSKVRLISLVEEAARKASVNIGQLRPEEGEPSADGVIESVVELRARGLSAERLQDFLTRLEQSRGIVIVKRLKINKPYRKDTVDIELTVTTFKVKSYRG